MTTATASAASMLPQLESARKLALGDALVYTQVIPSILPIIGPGAPLEVRRWGADFLAEGFASPALQSSQKEQMVADVLPTLKLMLEDPNEDMAVLRSAIQASASVYPLVFSRMYVTSPFQNPSCRRPLYTRQKFLMSRSTVSHILIRLYSGEI